MVDNEVLQKIHYQRPEVVKKERETEKALEKAEKVEYQRVRERKKSALDRVQSGFDKHVRPHAEGFLKGLKDKPRGRSPPERPKSDLLFGKGTRSSLFGNSGKGRSSKSDFPVSPLLWKSRRGVGGMNFISKRMKLF